METLYIAGGCFWGLEELLRQEHGVVETEVGYMGGENDHPTYENHPGHAEAVKVLFDPSKTSYAMLLDFFFRIHDPTTRNRQGNDRGTSYRSAVFYQTASQKYHIEKAIDIVNKSGLYAGKAVTEVERFSAFWPAEEYHQDYLQKNPMGYTCHFVRQHHPFDR